MELPSSGPCRLPQGGFGYYQCVLANSSYLPPKYKVHFGAVLGVVFLVTAVVAPFFFDIWKILCRERVWNVDNIGMLNQSLS